MTEIPKAERLIWRKVWTRMAAQTDRREYPLTGSAIALNGVRGSEISALVAQIA